MKKKGPAASRAIPGPLTCCVLLAALIACRSQPEVLKTRDVATVEAASGAVSLQLVPDPGSPDVRLGPGEEYVAPQLHPSNLPPAYPPELIASRVKPHTIVLRVTFDERGRVADIGASPVGASTDSAHRDAFERSAREAIATWRCYPPRIRKFRPGPDADGDGKADFRILASERVLKVFFDVAFDFAVVDGVPIVRPR